MHSLKKSDSSSSLVGSSADASDYDRPEEDKSHAQRPKLMPQEERRALLDRVPQAGRQHPGARSAKAESKGRGQSSKPSLISTPPAIPPRSTSLDPEGNRHLEKKQVVTPAISKTGSRPSPARERKDEPDTSDKKKGRGRQALPDFRKNVLAKDNAVAAMDEVRQVYTSKSIRHFPKKERTLLGNTKWICADKVSPEENEEYFEKVWELYQSTEDNAEVLARMAERIKETQNLKRTDHQMTAATSMVNLMIFRLTPNQRHQLRQEFPLLYFSATVTDDVNWLFFDTIVRSTTPDETRQKELMLKLYQTPRDRHLRKREKIRDEILKARYKIRKKRIREGKEIGDNRLMARDKIRDKLHGKMSREQREELKEICKARYDELTNSKLPVLHVLIREENQQAMLAYMNKVLRYAPPAERARLLMARCDTGKGKETGDAAFFALAHSGNVDMMGTYLKKILETKDLTVSQKSEVLKAFRAEDGVTPFHFIMCGGDWPRVQCFIKIIYNWKHAENDYLGVDDDTEKGNESYTISRPFVNSSLAQIVTNLLIAPVDDHTRQVRTRNAYTSAIELGKTECARKFKKEMRHRRMRDLFFSADLTRMTILEPSNPKKNTREQDEAACAKANEEASLDEILGLLDVEGKDPKQRDRGFYVKKLVKETLDQAAEKRWKEYPEVLALTVDEGSAAKLKLYAMHKYMTVNEENRRALERKVKEEEKRSKKRASLPSSAKPLSASNLDTVTQYNISSSPSDNSLHPDGSPASARVKPSSYPPIRLGGIMRSVHSMPSFDSLPAALRSPPPSESAEAKAVAPPPTSPSSPYQKKKHKPGDEERLIETSEGS